MPATLCSQRGWKRKPINPIFFAPYDIQPGGLTEELKERLRNSRNLIVVCSPNSAQSKWVGLEISYFHELGRTDHIHFFIVDGVPHSGNKETECFNPVVNQLGIPEILGANIHEKVFRWAKLNKERAYVQLITKLLGVEFDSIWQRHRRMLIQKIICWIVGCIAVIVALLATWLINQPVDVNIKIEEQTFHNKNLPVWKNAKVTLILDNEKKSATIQNANSIGSFPHVPHKYLGKEVRMLVKCTNFISLDTTLVLNRQLSLPLRRDNSVYGNVKFRIMNTETEQMVPNCKVTIAGIQTKSDKDGIVKLQIPLEKQDVKYKITSEIPLADTYLYMPCGDYDVIRIQN